MPSHPRLGFRAVAQVVGAYARIGRTLRTVGHVARLVTDGALGAALATDEKTQLTVQLYDLDAQLYDPAGGLWDWEEAWLGHRLPPAPARILIGAAGAGREALALAARGYQVAAFEPAPVMCARAATAAGGRFPVVCADYTDLADAVAGRPGGDHLAAIVGREWDAVLFGWTSFSHVLDPAERVRVLAAAATLAPHGPILVSFVVRLGSPGAPSSRIWRMARRLGRAAGRARGLDPDAGDAGIQFGRSIGFVRPFGPDELDAMAAAIGRTAIHEAEAGFPHATLVPGSSTA